MLIGCQQAGLSEPTELPPTRTVVAKVSVVDRQEDHLLIDKGSDHGIYPGDTVHLVRKVEGPADSKGQSISVGSGFVILTLHGERASRIIPDQGDLRSVRVGDTALVSARSLQPDTFEASLERLRNHPTDVEARAQFFLHLQETDKQTMESMRYHHSTKAPKMLHYYPSHRYVHPFLRGCLFAQQAEEDRAREEFAGALMAAELHVSKENEANSGFPIVLASVIAEQARYRLEELRKTR